MAKTSVNRVRRHAAGHLCLTLFHIVTSGVVHPLRTVADTRDTGLGSGLNEAERKFVRKLAADLNDNAEILRKLGWRFLKK